MRNITKVISLIRKEFRKTKKPTVKRTSEKKDAFKTLVSCLLSLRTQDRNTAKASASLFKVADNPKKILNLPIKKLERLIYSSGYYHNKAKTIKHVSKVILEKYNGKVPSDFDELISIKGIGRKTANIVLCFAYNKNVLPIDIHCHRTPNRLGWVKTKTPEQTEFALMKIVPEKHWREFNSLFILFGQNICKPIKPLCFKCPVEKYCKYPNKTQKVK